MIYKKFKLKISNPSRYEKYIGHYEHANADIIFNE